jgi:hypothetical protein
LYLLLLTLKFLSTLTILTNMSSSTSAAQYKKEKKVMEEKVQKVRQVVPTIKTNEIILALHNYDLDVERTIQAFLEEGSGALGDWENTAKSKKSKKKNNTTAKTNSTTSSTVDSTTGTFKQNGKSTSSNKEGYANGYTNGVTPSTIVSASSSAVKPKQAPKITTTSNLDNIDRLNSEEKSKVLSAELNALNRHQTDLNKVQKQFDGEISNAETSIAQCFKEIRQIAADRERQLLAALSRVREEGTHYLSARHSELRHLQSSAQNSNEDSVVAELKRFLANKQHDLELGHVTRFVYDNSQLINSIARFGEIVSINGATVLTPIVHSHPSQSNEIKHATSHSSLVSSVGEDSGLGQISPVANEKNTVHVEGSGIKMQSNAISVDQLAEIQRQLAEQLKAQGIDPSVLAGASATLPPPRRRQQQQHQNGNNKKQQQNGNKKNNKPSIELSILN